ncbi:MAG: copper amine oxidase [Clostridiales bacterium]|nr:copper amine oxidase [Clostridiales bacterium]
MFKKILTFIFAAMLIFSLSSAAAAVSLSVDSREISQDVYLINSTTYVPIRAVSETLSADAKISWEGGRAIVKTPQLTITARPDNCYIEANGRMLYVPDGVRLINGRTLVPVRVLAKAFGAEVSWNPAAVKASLIRGSGTIASGEQFYNSDSVYWLSRIISAESEGESLHGKIAVGNVILNRTKSPSYPNTIYEVIFDNKWGVQFTPTANGSIYKEPSAESVLAAKLCLDGASAAGESLYFLNPQIATSFWISQSCSYVTTIGNHVFYA